jgi:hypothetical protein
MTKKSAIYWCSVICMTLHLMCQNRSDSISSEYQYISPKYGMVGLKVTNDTLFFPYKDTLYHKIRSFNTFINGGVTYVSFFDRKQQLIFIYDFYTRQLVSRISALRFFHVDRSHYSLWVKNFDSIFVFNEKTLQLYDSIGMLKKKINFLKAKPMVQFYTNGNPLVCVGDKIYTGIHSPVTRIDFEMLKKQKIMYEFDITQNESHPCYSYPAMYYNEYLGYPFLNSSYCYNNNGRFVISFGADSLIYETDFDGYHSSYYAKSIFQKGAIKPVAGKEETFKEGIKNYSINCAYGPIYYDPFRNRYLRVVLHPMSEADYKAKKTRSQSLIIFDKQFRIIGEVSIKENIDMERLFFIGGDAIYAEVIEKNKLGIRFVRISYEEKLNQLTMK